jgi:hypothetical protein
MSKTTINFIVDAVAFAAFLFLAATGGVLRYVLPPRSGHFSTLWGMDRHQWGEVHFWIAATLLIALAFHLFLHWRWIVSVVRGSRRGVSGARVGLALATVVAILGIAAAPFFGSRESKEGSPPHRMRSDQEPDDSMHQINGSMTLLEVEQRTGVPAAAIVKELGLPSDLPTDEQLGRLRRKYGFEMSKVREAVQRQIEQQKPQNNPP